LLNAEPTQPVKAAKLALPSPEELGLALHQRLPQQPVAFQQSPPVQAVPAQPVDWNRTLGQLNRLGAVGFHLDRLQEGMVRVSFHLPTNQPQRLHVVEAVGRSEGEAVALALRQAETWTGRRD
jgi:hypothetical protein